MSGRQDLFQQAMNQGHSAAWDQLWDRAAACYRQAVTEFPDHPHALTSLGLALYELQEYEEALQCYQSAARVSPEDPVAIEKMAQLFERLGKLDQASQAALHAAELYLKNRDANKAIENWSRVTRLSPENLRAHSRLAMVYERLGEKQKAATEYLAVASLLQGAGDLEKAARSVSQALQLTPNSETALQAITLLKNNKPLPKPARPRGGTAPLRMAQVRQLQAPQAETRSESGLDPAAQAGQKALTVLAGMLFEGSDENQEDNLSQRGLQSIMRGAAQRSMQIDRTRIILHLSQVVDLQTRGENEQAAAELEKAVDAGLDHPAAYYDLGFLRAQGDQPEEAVRSLQVAVKSPDYALGARLLMGEAQRKMGHLKEASLEYLEALKLADSQVVNPEQADDLRQLYEPLIEAQRQQTSEEAQVRICDNIHGLLVRSNWQAHLTRARAQLPAHNGGSPPIPLAEMITAARSGHVVESISNIYTLAQQGYLRSAMEEAFYALQNAPTYLPLHSYMGELLLKQERIPEAIEKFLVVARTYSTRGEPKRAIDLYRRIVELSPVDLNSRSRLIEQLISEGQLEEALKEYFELADVYFSLADLDMARKTYTEALRLAQQPHVDRAWRVKFLHRIADIDLQSLDWRQAIRVFEQIRTLQPDDDKSRTSLVELNLRLGQENQAMAELDNFISYLNDTNQRDRAIRFVKNLVNENQGRTPLRRRLAELYHQDGKDKEAIEQMDAIGEALLTAGDRKGAIQAVQSILALNPPNKPDYQRLLAQLSGK